MRTPRPDQRAQGSPLAQSRVAATAGHRPRGVSPTTSCPTFVRRSLPRFGTVVLGESLGDIPIVTARARVPSEASAPQRPNGLLHRQLGRFCTSGRGPAFGEYGDRAPMRSATRSSGRAGLRSSWLRAPATAPALARPSALAPLYVGRRAQPATGRRTRRPAARRLRHRTQPRSPCGRARWSHGSPSRDSRRGWDKARAASRD